MAFHRPLTVRSAALRRRVLSFEKANSMGLKSGLYGGRKRRAASVLDHAADPLSLVTGKIVYDDQIAGMQFGNEDLFDIGLEGGAVDHACEDERRGHATPASISKLHGSCPISRDPAVDSDRYPSVFVSLAIPSLT